jgi:hypothetical protein
LPVPFFSEGQFADEWIGRFNDVFSTLYEKVNRDFGTEKIHESIQNYIEHGCNLPPPSLVILSGADEPNSNENVYKACDMFLDDFGANSHGTLDLACDQAIYQRLNNYSNPNQKLNCILGAWHTNKAMCNTLIAAFSGYGIFGMARSLGAQYLDKLEKVVDYRSTFRVLELIWAAVGIAIYFYKENNNMSNDDILAGNNNILKVWLHYYKWAGLLKLHKMGIRMANLDLQLESLKAFAPLFPITGKSRYAESVTRFLAHVSKNPEFKKRLQATASINLTENNRCLGHDEALERLGVKFVKQNLPGRVKDSDHLKDLIKTVQVERERMLMIYDEFVDQIDIKRKTRNVDERRQAMWRLTDELLTAFEDNLPENSILFKETTQLTREGYLRFFTSYGKGVTRLETILRQDVELIERRDTKGRRKKDLKSLKVKDFGNISNYIEEEMDYMAESPIAEMMPEEQLEPMEIDQINEIIEPSEANVTAKIRHKPTPQEEVLLRELEQNANFLSAEVVEDLEMKLKEYTNYWTRNRLYNRWYNRCRRKKTS